MALSIGIVGLPNVGKSTLFNVKSTREQEGQIFDIDKYVTDKKAVEKVIFLLLQEKHGTSALNEINGL